VATISIVNKKLIDLIAMILQSQLDYFKEVGIWYTGIPSLDASIHTSSFKRFLSREEEYKRTFLQSKLNYAFDGYSFFGQEDSLNQGADDKVFTYVLSDFFEPSKQPQEFWPLLKAQVDIIDQIAELEKELLDKINPQLHSFFENQIGHMLSANYYPPNNLNGLRLTSHPDVSLITVFPFGMDEQFQFEMPEGSWQTIGKTDEVICFSGYLLECMTGIKALNHKVEKDGDQDERFSFAYFSIPRPNQKLDLEKEKITSEVYFTRYLSLFD